MVQDQFQRWSVDLIYLQQKTLHQLVLAQQVENFKLSSNTEYIHKSVSSQIITLFQYYLMAGEAQINAAMRFNTVTKSCKLKLVGQHHTYR